MSDKAKKKIREAVENEVRRTLKNRKRINPVFSKEVAEDQLVVWLDAYDIYIGDIIEEKIRTIAEECQNKVLIAIQYKKVTLNADGTFVQHLESGTDLPYKLLKGSAKTQTKTKRNLAEDAQATERQYAIMGSLCSIGATGIKTLHHKDMSVAESIGFLLTLV